MQAEQRDLTPKQRSDIADIRSGMALTQADRARQRGVFADAYDLLYVHLAANQQNTSLLAGLARIYGDAGQYREAQTIYAQILEIEPNNVSALRGAVGSAISARDVTTAKILLEQAVRAHPTNPGIYYLVGEAARARGDTRTAREAYKTAKHLREQELAAMAASGGAVQDVLPSDPFNNVGQPRGTFAAPSTRFSGPGPAPVQPTPGANPFDQSSHGEEILRGGEGAGRMVGDDRGDVLLAQAALGPNARGHQTYGADSRII